MSNVLPLARVQLLTPRQRQSAYDAIDARFGLDVAKRHALDHSPIYPNVMSAAHRGEWVSVEQMLEDIALGTDR